MKQKRTGSQKEAPGQLPLPPEQNEAGCHFSVRRKMELKRSVHAELSLYLKEELEPEGTNKLKYWFVRQKKLPTLSKMARIYLAIPATSAASERVFSKGRGIVSLQRSSLNPDVVEELLCIKEWCQLTNGSFHF
ncbi:uncharacterized protein VP01_609g9 [Puccinia sorghi]|uniref:HAT C-terminal dimerisation domain-containing protein n=1 Tax=Puccinia sorghi TaxID=27349 RepID=A0A0L6UH40_9BASI|nr:uncharacterized protein VP01_609g9 [Puccinia sorghi]